MKCRAYEVLRKGAIGLLGLGMLLQGFVGMPQTGYAQDEPEIIPTGIPPLSPRVSLLGVPLSVLRDLDGDGVNDFGSAPGLIPIPRVQELAEITFVIEDRTPGRAGLSIEEDFLALESAATSSGLALYKESLAVPDRFNFTQGDPSNDRPVDLLAPPTVQADPTTEGRFFITMRPVPGTLAAQVPIQQTQFPSYYLVGRTTLNLLHGDRFEVTVPADGIRVRDFSSSPPPKLTAFDFPFPGPEFAEINPSFAEPSVFQGDLVTIQNLIRETDNTNRIDINSEPRSILGIDFVGRPDQDYFIKEMKVNFIGLNLSGISKLLESLTQPSFFFGGANSQSAFHPSFFYSPYFYNFPEDPENPGFIQTEIRDIGGQEVEYPVTSPLDFFGVPRSAFILGLDNPNSHVTSYVGYGPREIGSSGLLPSHVVNSEVLLEPLPNGAGGIFMFRDEGGTRGGFDEGIDRVIRMDGNGIRVSSFPLTPELVNENAGIREAIQRLLPARVGGDIGRSALVWLFQDTNLAEDLLGVPGALLDEIAPVDPLTEPRPPYGSLECYLDPNCYFFDELINLARPYLGLTEGTVRYLHSMPENEKINMLELFETELLQAFTYTLPVVSENAIGDLQAPISRSGNDGGPDIYLAVRTSDKLRNLDGLLPFILPEDITVSANLTGFLAGEETENLPSVASVGVGRADTDVTAALIGRPRPRYQFRDLTTPGEGIFASNDNIIFDRSQSSPPKAVVGIDVTDFGQNPTTLENPAGTNVISFFDSFFTESTVWAELQIDFLPGNDPLVFLPGLFSSIPRQNAISQSFTFPVSIHSTAIYVDDDTPSGDGIDNDGDGLIDEEIYNLQDDDADGLIDEDLGDDTPAGLNGVFDSQDNFMPAVSDQIGFVPGLVDTQYVFEPSSTTKFEAYTTAVLPDDAGITLEDGFLLPLSPGENTWFHELDFRALQFENIDYARGLIFPTRGLRPYNPGGPPLYNQGMFSALDPRQGLIDFFWQVLPGDPYPENFCIEDIESGEVNCLLELVSEGDGNIAVVPAPDPADPLALRTSFLLSMAGGLRMPNPFRGFVRVGNTPMTLLVPSDNAIDLPQGSNQPDPPALTQFGYVVQTAEPEALADFSETFGEAIIDAFTQVQETIDTYNEDVADAEADLEPGEDPDYPDFPEAIEIQLPDPFESLGINPFNEEAGPYSTNYTYQVQLPDENFGPLAGDDYFVVLRTSPTATTGDSFRVRIRSGNTNAVVTTVDDDGLPSTVPAPAGGAQFMSFVDADYDEEEPFRGVSKTSVTTRPIVVRSQNVSPSITFNSPRAGTNLTTSLLTFEIAYIVQDPDNAPEVRLFVDDNGIGFDGQFLNGSLLRPTVGAVAAYSLNLPQAIENFDPTQPYFIYAVVDDGVNPPVFTYADGPITTPAAADDGDGGGSGGGGNQAIGGEVFNPVDYMKVVNDGRTFSLGDFPPINDLSGTALFTDTEPTPGFVGVIGLQNDGKLFAVGDVSIFQSRVQSNQEIVFPISQVAFYSNSIDGGQLIEEPTAEQITIEFARDVEVDFQRGAIYILDGDGDMLFLGAAAVHSLTPPPVGLDIYRDMELFPNGENMYFLAGNGILSTAVGAPRDLWVNLVEDVNTYPDIELVTRGDAVRNVIITDNNGALTILGSDSGNANALGSLELQDIAGGDEITPGSIRQVKQFPSRSDLLMLVSGGGVVHYLASDDLDLTEVPVDTVVFSDEPGLDNDSIIDVETANIDLSSVVDSIREILEAVSEEDTAKVLSFAAPNYSDRNGSDIRGLRTSLNSFFGFYEVQSFTESSLENSFIINNQGDTVTANVTLDYFYYFPEVQYELPEVEISSPVPESFGLFLFSDSAPAFPQNIRVREVFDGRGWNIEFWEITRFGRGAEDIIGNENPEFDDIALLLSIPGNRRIATYVPMNESIDPPMTIPLSSESLGFNNVDILVYFREQFLTRNLLPPAMEFVIYNGALIAGVAAVETEFEFSRQDDGSFMMTSMTLPQTLGENSEDLTTFDTDFDRALEQLNGLEVEQPFGFGFKERGPVVTTIEGPADFIFTGDQFNVIDPRGGIMMLPENTDIFTLNVENFIDSISRAQVFLNPFDPDTLDLDPGQASIQPGRAYFVVTRDGKNYGFFQVGENIDLDDDSGLGLNIINFDYRYEDSFVLPSGF